MLKRLIKKYRSLSFEDKTILATRFSILLNAFLAFIKFILMISNGVFFFVAGCMNSFIMISKVECYLGIKNPLKKSFLYRNKRIALFLLFAGVQYSIYMSQFVFHLVNTTQYSKFLAINIATISFLELGFAVKGLFSVSRKGHYFRNLKIISFCSAITAIVLTQVAITSLSSTTDFNILNGIIGMSVGGVISLLAIYVYFAPKISLIDRQHNTYKLRHDKEPLDFEISQKDIVIVLIKSFWYGNYIYQAKFENEILDGNIVKEKNSFHKLNIFLKIILIVLSEILVFIYAIGALIYFIKSIRLISKLDQKMKQNNLDKIVSLKEKEIERKVLYEKKGESL